MTDSFAGGAGAPIVGHPVGKTRNPWGAWALSFITCGIYFIYWWFKVNEEIKDYDTQVQVEPWMSAASLLLPVVGWVSIFRGAGRIAQAQETGGVAARANGWVGVLLLFLFGLQVVYYQTALNDLWAGGTEVPYGDPPVNPGGAAI